MITASDLFQRGTKKMIGGFSRSYECFISLEPNECIFSFLILFSCFLSFFRSVLFVFTFLSSDAYFRVRKEIEGITQDVLKYNTKKETKGILILFIRYILGDFVMYKKNV